MEAAASNLSILRARPPKPLRLSLTSVSKRGQSPFTLQDGIASDASVRARSARPLRLPLTTG
jgi:hypothetical protein